MQCMATTNAWFLATLDYHGPIQRLSPEKRAVYWTNLDEICPYVWLLFWIMTTLPFPRPLGSVRQSPSPSLGCCS